jgi:hypothetical protein
MAPINNTGTCGGLLLPAAAVGDCIEGLPN